MNSTKTLKSLSKSWQNQKVAEVTKRLVSVNVEKVKLTNPTINMIDQKGTIVDKEGKYLLV
jgi:predicted metalloenzyme YecM